MKIACLTKYMIRLHIRKVCLEVYEKSYICPYFRVHCLLWSNKN